jgi:hypothetical protein
MNRAPTQPPAPSGSQAAGRRNGKPAPGEPTPRPPLHIDLRLNDINQLFHSLDPSPFREKDLDLQAEEFIVEWARELPRTEPLLLTIKLARPPAPDYAQQAVADAVRNYFSYRAERTRVQYRELLRQGWKDLGIGLLFLFTCLLAAQFMERLGDETFINLLRESLIIGGWVAMWRPMEIFLYDRWPLMRRQRLFERLAAMDVQLEALNPG